MSPADGRDPRVLAIDAGGTMTDTFIVDRSGEFVVGKAQSTPEDESLGFMASTRDALRYWDTDPQAAMPSLASGIYSGTAMLNRLLERKGRRVGVIVTGGMEDMLRLERGIQTYLGYPYSDRLHVATHHHNEPLVPRELVKGVRERIDMFGEPAIPLYEDEARRAVEEPARPASRASSSACSTATATPSTRTASRRSPARSHRTRRSSSPRSSIRCAATSPASTRR